MMDFTGRHILVTGASSGMGRATALLLAKRGANVSLVARRLGALESAVSEIRADGGTAEHFVADVGNKAALLSAFDRAEAAFGPIDGLFANAGTGGRFSPFADYDDQVFEDVLRANVSSPFWAIKRVLPGMIAKKHGAIVVTGSLASERGMANNPGYVASKHALLGLARAAAIEVAPHGIRVNCLVPGFIDTPMMDQLPPQARVALAQRSPTGRMGTSEEMAEVAAFLLSDAASYVTGQSWSVDGGVLGTLAVGG